MKVDVFDMKGKKVNEVDLPERIFEAPINVDLIHQAFVRQMANARLGTHKTKTRSEVRGGGRKPWRQKGTGRARQGSIRSAQWVGGGKIHTPRPRDYSKRMPRKMRRAALRSALTVKATENNIVLIDDLTLEEPKTRLMAESLNHLVGKDTALVLIPERNRNYQTVKKSIHNLTSAKSLNANYLNIRDLLSYNKIVIPLAALDVVKTYLA